MRHFARDCADQALRSCYWAFVIALVIARCFLGDRDALAVSSTVMEHVALPFAGASVVLISARRLLKKP